MKIFFDKDADLSVIRGRRVAVVGFGSQGQVHAQNLRDSGVRQLRVAELAGPPGARGIAGMNRVASNTAEYGEYRTGPRIVDARVRQVMRDVLAEIRSGEFAREWVLENQSGQANLRALRARTNAHPIESIGPRIRSLMPWLAGK